MERRREGGCTKEEGLRKKARLGAREDFNTFMLMSGITHGRRNTSDITHAALRAWCDCRIQTAEEVKYASSSNPANMQLREGRVQGCWKGSTKACAPGRTYKVGTPFCRKCSQEDEKKGN